MAGVHDNNPPADLEPLSSGRSRHSDPGEARDNDLADAFAERLPRVLHSLTELLEEEEEEGDGDVVGEHGSDNGPSGGGEARAAATPRQPRPPAVDEPRPSNVASRPSPARARRRNQAVDNNENAATFRNGERRYLRGKRRHRKRTYPRGTRPYSVSMGRSAALTTRGHGDTRGPRKSTQANAVGGGSLGAPASGGDRAGVQSSDEDGSVVDSGDAYSSGSYHDSYYSTGSGGFYYTYPYRDVAPPAFDQPPRALRFSRPEVCTIMPLPSHRPRRRRPQGWSAEKGEGVGDDGRSEQAFAQASNRFIAPPTQHSMLVNSDVPGPGKYWKAETWAEFYKRQSETGSQFGRSPRYALTEFSRPPHAPDPTQYYIKRDFDAPPDPKLRRRLAQLRNPPDRVRLGRDNEYGSPRRPTAPAKTEKKENPVVAFWAREGTSNIAAQAELAAEREAERQRLHDIVARAEVEKKKREVREAHWQKHRNRHYRAALRAGRRLAEQGEHARAWHAGMSTKGATRRSRGHKKGKKKPAEAAAAAAAAADKDESAANAEAEGANGGGSKAKGSGDANRPGAPPEAEQEPFFWITRGRKRARGGAAPRYMQPRKPGLVSEKRKERHLRAAAFVRAKRSSRRHRAQQPFGMGTGRSAPVFGRKNPAFAESVAAGAGNQ